MAVEIERKFLVSSLPDGLDGYPHALLEQGYLAVARDGGEVRIRRRGGACTLTVKQGSGVSRREEEIEISGAIFDSLWPATEGKRLEKVRYHLPAGDLTIELDRYLGALDGLIVAEVEFPTEESAAAWTPPEWFGREVMDDSSYKNQRLALQGQPPEYNDGPCDKGNHCKN
jgi:adenylate cyclase